MSKYEYNGIYVIDKVVLDENKRVTIYFKENTHMYCRIEILHDALCKANLFEAVLNYGIEGLKMEIKDGHIVRIYEVIKEKELQQLILRCDICDSVLNDIVINADDGNYINVKCSCGKKHMFLRENFPFNDGCEIIYPAIFVEVEKEVKNV